MDVDTDHAAVDELIRMSADSIRAGSLPPELHDKPFTVGYVYSSKMTQHFRVSGHEEQPERIVRIWKSIVDANLHVRMKRLPIVIATRKEVCLVHTEDLWSMVNSLQNMTEEQIIDTEPYYDQLSVYVNTGTTRSALLSCGGVIQACLSVVAGTVEKAFAIVRPPGHHAEPDQEGGFCFFNNVAVAAKVVQETTRTKRIMILDWDVHHGNGTQRAFDDDPSILYVSLHRYDGGIFYPGGAFGALDSCGTGDGEGYSVNIPWPGPGMGDGDYIYAFMKIVMPIATQFAPELVIISAGFDAVEGDPLGQCLVTPVGYAHMTHMLSGLAGGKLVVALEGGYHLDATAAAALAVTKVLLGEAPEPLPPVVATDNATETVWMVARQQSRYWKDLDVNELEPKEEMSDALTVSIPELLKQHRQHFLYRKCGMMQVPLMRDTFESSFSSQVMCSADIHTARTVIVLIHEAGNIRLELSSSTSCDVNLQTSYLIDSAQMLAEWGQQEGIAILDINLFPKPFTDLAKMAPEAADTLKRGILTYMWDNFIQLTDIENVIMIGHEAGCGPLMRLVNDRFNQFENKVKAIIQIIGHAYLPMIPKALDTRNWYRDCSYIVVPEKHLVLTPEMRKKNFRRHGVVTSIDEKEPNKMILRALSSVQGFAKSKLDAL